MQSTSHLFKDNASRALKDAHLQQALVHVRTKFIVKRAQAIDALPEFDALRDAARDLKDHVLSRLDEYLVEFECNVVKNGGLVHWCATPAEARKTILDICRNTGAKTVTKGKTMVGEEIGINDHLAANGIEPIETDLGEYIIQLRGEAPSHIIAPSVHVTKDQVEETFRRIHTDLDPKRNLEEPSSLLHEARVKLRGRFIAADVGITGANFLIADTGTTTIVTNEGNGDLTQTLPRIHIVLAGIEKIVPSIADAGLLLRVLARSATGQEMSAYTTFSTGPRRPGDVDGPEQFHVVLVDNGRSKLLGTEFEEMLRCIRCGACLNHCPIYHTVGGHAYGWVYAGPIGAITTPALIGIEHAAPLPEASSLCGRCESVCPVRIPIPKMLRAWREEAFERRLHGNRARWALKAWAALATRPALYRIVTGVGMRMLALLGGKRGRLTSLPLAEAWTEHRDLPAPQGRTFMAMYRGKK
ncbi:MAG TPA: LutB/LldF family L-lactate oxidation iron-sulfur protein [Dongiaceae bacterium]|jgi:L-lactate dehydrogenase complex protein LldF|nr:LutB/LldF family L-lactate oxidation iron-sulfur protein [Dongiaceae bacterium]